MEREPQPYQAHEGALLAEIQWVGRLALRLVEDANRVDDACQEAWLRLRGGEGALPGRGEILKTLRRILYRERRAEQRRALREAAKEALPQAEAVDVLLARREQLQRIWDAVLRLPEPLRRTLLLHFQEGLTTTAIAEREGCPADTVRWRIRNGVERLRVGLGEDRDGGGLAGLLLAVPISLGGIDGRALAVVSKGAVLPWIGGLVVAKTLAVLTAIAVFVVWFAWPEKPGPTGGQVALMPDPDSTSKAEEPHPPSLLEGVTAERQSAAAPGLSQPGSLPTLPEIAAQPPVLRVHLDSDAPGPLPDSVDIAITGLQGSGVALYSQLHPAGGAVELGASPFLPYHEQPMECSLELRAAGWATALIPSFQSTPGITQELRIPMRRVREFPVRLVDVSTGAPVRSPRCSVLGPGADLGGFSIGEDGRTLLVRVAPQLEDDDWALLTAADHTPCPCRLLDLVAIPPGADGVREFPMYPGATLTGVVEREDGLPLEGQFRIEYRVFPQFAKSLGGPLPASLPGRRPIGVAPDGTFQIGGLPEGDVQLTLLRLADSGLHQPVRESVQTAVLAEGTFHVRIAVPMDPVMVTVELDWIRESSEADVQYAQWIELYRLESESDGPYAATPGPRQQLWKTVAVQGQPTRLPLPRELVDSKIPLLLCIGPDPVLRIERRIEFSGPAPTLKYRFPKECLAELRDPSAPVEHETQAEGERGRQDPERLRAE
ncbi:MAG: RNA polymerase sigma factor [Planctomycetota bacterium]